MAAKSIKIYTQCSLLPLFPCSQKHTFRHQNQVDSSIRPKDIENVDFKWRPVWNSTWRLIGTKYMRCRLLPLDSLPPKHTFRHQNRVNNKMRPKVNRKCRFQMAAILNSNMADMKREFRMAQYLKMLSLCTFVPYLVLVSQNAQ